MRAVVIYESMFGSTRSIAEAIAHGLATHMDVEVIRAADARTKDLRNVGLLVLGAPTHMHGLPRPITRSDTPNYVRKSKGRLILEPGADTASGVREWLATLDQLDLKMPIVCFDTRANGPGFLTGRAACSIARTLRRRGASLLCAPESFRTTKNQLVTGEYERAVALGRSIGARCAQMDLLFEHGVR